MTSFTRLGIPEVIEILPAKFGDDRGFFSEVWKRSDLAAKDINIDWVQDNHSFSADAGTIRGFHYQLAPFAQDKLVRVTRGAIYDVAVDIRIGSPTYGKWVGLEVSANKWNQLLVPAGFAHGFMTIAPNTEVMYKVSAPYSPQHERAIVWNDRTLAIKWPDLGVAPILSAKDGVAPNFTEQEPAFYYASK